MYAVGDYDGAARELARNGVRVSSIHPGQIDPINQAFTPDAAQYERAERIATSALSMARARTGYAAHCCAVNSCA